MAPSAEQSRINGRKGGRKKGLASIKAEEMRAYMVKRVAEEAEQILSGQLEAAKGMWIEQVIDGVSRRVYQKLPDLRAAEYLLDQSVGRASQSIQHSGEITSKVINIDE